MAEEVTTEMVAERGKKLNVRQALFARLVGLGKSQVDAYAEAYGKPSTAAASALARRPKVAAEISRLREETAAASVIKRDEILRLLALIIRTPVGDLHERHPLTQEMTVRRHGETEIVRVKAMPKIEAIKLLCQMCGWMKPEANEEPLTVVLKKMW